LRLRGRLKYFVRATGVHIAEPDRSSVASNVDFIKLIVSVQHENVSCHIGIFVVVESELIDP
jgi:hypothetical protein